MNIKSEKDGDVATVTLEGVVDTRAAQEFEQHVVGLVGQGARSLVIDLAKVELITSAGIRVLVMMAQRLQRNGGGLALCAISAKVRGIFDIAGLLNQFKIVDTKADATAHLKTVSGPRPAPRARRASKLTRLMTQVLEEDDAIAPEAGSGTRSALTEAVATLLKPQLDAPGDTGAVS